MNNLFIPGHQNFGADVVEANKVQDTICINQRVNLSSCGENKLSHFAPGSEHIYLFCFVVLLLSYFY